MKSFEFPWLILHLLQVMVQASLVPVLPNYFAVPFSLHFTMWTVAYHTLFYPKVAEKERIWFVPICVRPRDSSLWTNTNGMTMLNRIYNRIYQTIFWCIFDDYHMYICELQLPITWQPYLPHAGIGKLGTTAIVWIETRKQYYVENGKVITEE